MLKDAALLQLDILELALENGWTLKMRLRTIFNGKTRQAYRHSII